jgi:hypothetical protein
MGLYSFSRRKARLAHDSSAEQEEARHE